MRFTYTRAIAKKILLAFLACTIVAVLAALVALNTITDKLGSISKLATNIEQNQSKPEQILLLIHRAEDDFQESLLTTGNNKYADYNTKIVIVFSMIDSLLKENADTSKLTASQSKKVKYWYHEKMKLSDRLFVLKRSFDSLLTIYSDFNRENTKGDVASFHTETPAIRKIKTDTVLKVTPREKKGFFKRIKDAIANKNEKSVVEINHYKNVVVSPPDKQKTNDGDKKLYARKLELLRQKNQKLLTIQSELIILNSHISNELEFIINNIKDINYKLIDEFKVVALKNYEQTTSVLVRFYISALFLVLLFAVLLIVFIIQLNKAEVLLRNESEQSAMEAQQRIDDLMKKIELNERSHSPSKLEALKEIVQLAVNNNPAFLIKFNEFDPDFSQKLLKIAPHLVASEIELCILLRLNFETKEIARHTKASVRAIESKKYRVRKKLNIPSDKDINIWMAHI
ncbi:hypothetical protein J7E50_01850 [Pedobacter sp. ISL-68]|uniref:helix-turn-helix transcriptional regulator n=1 Tax=unclassified Pedobacter TaxID=2628915 RepID=UPI001BEB3DE5|nr:MULTISPECIES: hypothetical protein [unclassified Pedobacter]MBT2562286.1 hypothetical protein [Pedobacter sp. ISL-64]MBT2588943.1 hypothetical protein [Pedobacter sp. ISL-68]